MTAKILIDNLNDKTFCEQIQDKVFNILYKRKVVLVIMPTYNRPVKCIAVIKNMLEQTYKNFDLLIIDDGSLENSYNKIALYVKNIAQKHIILMKNMANIRVAKTLNAGLRFFFENNYEYVTWISDDNEYYPNFIDQLVNLKGKFSYTSFDYQSLFNSKARKVNRKYKDINDLIEFFSGCASFMWSRQTVKKVGFYDENLYGPEDYDYLLRTFINLDIDDIKYSTVSGMKYILHKDCLSIKNKKDINESSKNIKTIYNILVKNNKYNIEHIKILLSDNEVVQYNTEKNELVISKMYENIVNNYIEYLRIKAKPQITLSNDSSSSLLQFQDQMKVSIVMVHYNTKEQIIRTLDGFETQYCRKYNFEVIIIDDNSDEDNKLTQLVKKNYSFYINLISISAEEKGNRKNSRVAYNKGFKKANGDIIIIQNPECYHVGDIIGHALNNLKEQDYFGYGCFSANSSEITKEMINSYNIRELITNQDFLRRNLTDTDIEINWYNYPADNLSADKQGTYYFCSAISKCKLDLINGFDERFADGYCFSDDEFMMSIRYNLKLNVSMINPEFCFVIHQYHTKNDVFCINAGNDEILKDKLLKNKNLYNEIKNHHESSAFKYPKLLHLYWDGSPMSFLNYITILSFNEYHKFWKIIVYMPSKKTNVITWKSHEQKLKYNEKCCFGDIYCIPNVVVKNVCLDEIGFYNDASEVIKSDYLRYHVLKKHGGLWSDFDIIYTASVEKKMSFDEDCIIFKGFSHSDPKNKLLKTGYPYFPIGFFLCTPQNTFFEYIRAQCIKNYDKNEYQSIGAGMWAKLFPSDEYIYNIDKSVLICDEKYYLPWAWNELYELYEKKDNVLPQENVGIHWFNGATQSKQYAIDLSHRITKNFHINTYIDKFVNKYIQHRKISIVMAYFNRKEQLIRTLDGFEKQYAEKYNFEVIIVDDNSNEENKLLEIIKKYNFQINLVEISAKEKGDRINPCTAYNKGFKEATGEIIIIQNPECYHVGDIIKYTLNNLKNYDYFSYSCFTANDQEITKEMINSNDVHK